MRGEKFVDKKAATLIRASSLILLITGLPLLSLLTGRWIIQQFADPGETTEFAVPWPSRTFDFDDFHWRETEVSPVAEGLVVAAEYVYYLADGMPPKVQRIPLSDFKVDRTLVLDASGVESMVSDGEYLYVGTWKLATETFARIIIIRLSDFSVVSSMKLEAGQGSVAGMYLAGETLFIGTTNMLLLKFDKSDPENLRQVDGRKIMPAGMVEEMADDGTYLYIPIDRTNPGVFVRVAMNDFSNLRHMVLPAGEKRCQNAVVFGDYVYAVCNTSPGKVLKIRISDFDYVETLSLGAFESGAKDMVEFENALYVLLRSTPHKLVKINLVWFRKLWTLNFRDGIMGGIEALGFHARRRKLYVAFDVGDDVTKLREIDVARLE